MSIEEDATRSTMAASRALLGIVARSLAPALEHLTLPQYRVLVVLASDGEQRMGLLAERIGVHASTVTRTVERLEKGGWLTRAQAPGNRREVRVRLTEQGASLVVAVTAARSEAIADALERLAPGEQEAVRAGMELLARAAGEPDPADLLELGL